MDFNERRKYKRLSLEIEATFQIEGESNIYKAKVKNFSREGLCLVLENNLLDNILSPIHFSLCLNYENTVLHFPLIGKIAWTKVIGKDKYIGVVIVDTEKLKKSELLEFLYNIWRKKVKDGAKRDF